MTEIKAAHIEDGPSINCSRLSSHKTEEVYRESWYRNVSCFSCLIYSCMPEWPPTIHNLIMSFAFFFSFFLKTPYTNRRKKGCFVLICIFQYSSFFYFLVHGMESRFSLLIFFSVMFVCYFVYRCPRYILLPQITKTATKMKKNGECHVDVRHARS